MTDEELERNVADELRWDPAVGAARIAASAAGGTVNLRGTVGSVREKREAQNAAERVHGVVLVDNLLVIRIRVEHRRADAALRGDVLRALMLDALVPATVDASVKDGFVTLGGTVDWHYQRDEAVFIAGNVRGVTGIRNDVYLTSPAPFAGEVKFAIRSAIERAAAVAAGAIGVETLNGAAILTGSARSRAERDSAMAAAWAAPGITRVEDRIDIVY